jgi:lipid II:glycine glycyltransferase (peptidoglycan interpeptide bridge formation enzyme)
VKIAMQDYNVEIDRVEKEEWSNLLLEFADATIYQTWSYGAVRWGNKNISHLVLKKNGAVVGLSQLIIKKMPVLGAGIAYVPWGPLWRKEASECNINNLKVLLRSLYKEYVVNRNLLLRIAPNIIENGSSEICSIFEELGFKKNISVAPYRTLLVDLSPSLLEIRKKLDQKWRNQLNRSEKNGLNIIEGAGDELYNIFLKLQK